MTYLPAMTTNLKEKKQPKIRLLLQGPPGSGKTFSAMTFPNPIVIDLDDGLTAFTGKDIPVIPFCQHDFVCSYLKQYLPAKLTAMHTAAQPNRRDAILHFMKHEAIKLTEDQTLIIDGITGFETALAQQEMWEPKMTKENKVDDRHPWQMRLKYFKDLITYLKALRCNSVTICHEMKVRDEKTGALLEKISPLMQGRFIAEVKAHYTDCFRTVTEDVKNADKEVIKTNYFWQVRSDDLFDAKTRLAIPEGTVYVDPHYKIFTEFPYVTVTNPYNNKT